MKTQKKFNEIDLIITFLILICKKSESKESLRKIREDLWKIRDAEEEE